MIHRLFLLLSVCLWMAAAETRFHGYNAPGARIDAGANPPVAWSVPKRRAIRWRQRLTAGSLPVVGNGRVYATIEPDHLICLALADGDGIWQTELPLSVPAVIGEKKSVKPRLAWVPAVGPDAIVVATHTGELLCCGVDGSIRWHRIVGRPHPHWHARRHGFSPLIMGDQVVVAVITGHKQGAYSAFSLDDGSERWRVDVDEHWPRPLAGFTWGAEMGIVTAGGRFIDGSGKLLARTSEPMPHGEMPPVVSGQHVYFAGQNGTAAVQMLTDEEGGRTVRTRWHHKRRHWNGSTGLVVGGKFYVPRVGNKFDYKMPIPWNQLDIYDCDSGRPSRVYPVIRNGLAPLPLQASGSMLLVPDAGTSGHDQSPKGTELAYVDCSGDEPRLEALMSLPTGTQVSGVAAADGALLLRTQSHLICAAADDDESQEYESLQVAQRALDRVGGRPRPRPVLEAEPVRVPVADRQVDAFRLRHGPKNWLVVGPLPTAALPKDFSSALPRVADALLEGQRWRHIEDGELLRLGHEDDSEADHGLDVRTLFGEHKAGSVLAHSLLRVDEAVSVQYLSRGAERVWLGGEELGHDAVVRLRPGVHALLVQIAIAELPPDSVRPVVAVRFRPVVDPKDRFRYWLDAIRLERGRLEAVILGHPESPQSAHARALLKELRSLNP